MNLEKTISNCWIDEKWRPYLGDDFQYWGSH